jgi:hypothetical protein
MAMKVRGALIALAVVAVLLYASRPLLGCGPFFNVAIYSFAYHPDLPLDNFAAGRLGIVQAGWARSYLFTAYRYLAGPGFDTGERKALVSLWMDRINALQSPASSDAPKHWLEARGKVPGAGAAPEIDVNRFVSEQSLSYVNCPPDAFVAAASTLNEMISKFGASGAQVKDWLAAQDQVFSDCGGASAIPAAASAQMTPFEKAQRDYQIASANFYSGKFDVAQQDFGAIAKDPASPWRQIAPYLAARALIRKATLAPKLDNAALGEAESRLKKIASDTTVDAGLRSSALGLVDFIAFRLHPKERFAALTQALLKPVPGAALERDLWDYTLFMDGAVPENPGDMTEWIINFQSADAKSGDYALKRWQEAGALPWLVAALSKLGPANPAGAALMDAAAKVKPDSPAYTWLAYYRARLLVESGKAEPARALLDQVLADAASLPPSTRNPLLSLRMQVAANLAELLKYAQRTPAGIIFAGADNGEIPIELGDAKQFADFSAQPSFGPDSTAVLNTKMPIATLKAAAATSDLPANLRKQLQIAAWVRAVILEDGAAASALAPLARDAAPELKDYLQAFISAKTPAQKHYEAIYAILKLPGLRPFLDPGLGRGTPINKLDDYRDNWWCANAAEGGSAALYANTDHPTLKVEGFDQAYPGFLSAGERAAAVAQYKQLGAHPGPDYLAAQTVAWVNRAPNDPRAPEALHLAVNTTRYGCTGKQTGQFSKQAFDLLHRRYPASPWTAKTKFWFK